MCICSLTPTVSWPNKSFDYVHQNDVTRKPPCAQLGKQPGNVQIMLFSEYVVFRVCCVQSMLCSEYVVFRVCCVESMLCSEYVVFRVC